MKSVPFLSKYTRQRLLNALVVIFVVIGLGTVGFQYFENLTLVDAIYHATETVTTVGYGDLAPKTTEGRIFTTFFMLIGAGTVLFSLTVVAQAVVQSELFESLSQRHKLREMEKLKNHYIVCGAGRVGRRVIRNLQKEKLPFVVIEREDARLDEFDEEAFPLLRGDATLEENLLAAGVLRAKGLAACLPDDAANVYVVLTARGLKEDLHIVARAVEEQAEPKLIRAGANRVVAPTIIGSQAMARSLLKPAIADFMDSIVAETLDLVFEEIAIDAHSPYAGRRLQDTNLSKELSVIVIAIRRKSGELRFHPTGDTTIGEGDLLIVVGKADSVQKLVMANR